jgi:two-component system sensor histidine kinase SenX3
MFLVIVIALLAGGMIGFAAATARLRAAGRSPGAAAGTVGDQDDGSSDDVGMILRSAVNELELGVVVSDADGTIIYRNRAASTMHGTHVGLIIEEHLESALRSARAGASGEELVELHGPPRVALELLCEPMPNGFAVATMDDVSERTRIDLMRTDFVANISHELKTPVGAIAVLAEALAGETDPDVVNRVSGRMVDEAHRAVKAIDDLLELARIESGPRTAEVVDLADVVRVAIARGKVVDEAKAVKVTSIDSQASVLVRADERQLVSALGNLVENAVKYSDEAGLVQVRTRVDDRVIEIMVADQGDGIPARDLDRIFERFYRVDRARSRTTGGTGLGLSIVRHVASNHGGEVLVSSQEGEGSTFVLRLPASLIVSGGAGGQATENELVPPSLVETEVKP